MALSPEERHRRNREAERRWARAHPEYSRQWRAEHPDKEREYRQRSKERRAAYLAANREKILAQKRAAEHRRLARREAEAVRRAAESRRARAWAVAHPERVHTNQQAWVEANRERVRQQKLAYYYRHHDERKYANRQRNNQRRRDPDAVRQESRYRDHEHDRYKAHADRYRADPAKSAAQRERKAEWGRIERRRIRLGLPRVAGHHAVINERIDNERAADAFFARPRTRGQKAALADELVLARIDGLEAAARIREGMLDAAWRLLAEAERPARVEATATALLSTREGEELRVEARMDAIARRMRGLPPYPDIRAEVHRRAVKVAEGVEAERVARGRSLPPPRKPRAHRGPAPRARARQAVSL